MALKFTIDTSGIDAVKESIANACSRAEHTLAVQVVKDTIAICPDAHRIVEDADAGIRKRGHLPRPIRSVSLLR